MTDQELKNFDEADLLRIYARLKKKKLYDIYLKYTTSVLHHIAYSKILQFEIEDDEKGFKFPSQIEITDRILSSMNYLDFIYSHGDNAKTYLKINKVLSSDERQILDYGFICMVQEETTKKLQEDYRKQLSE